MVLGRADGFGLPADAGAISRGGAAGVDMDRVYYPAQLAQTRNAEGGVQPAGEGERDHAGRRLHIA
jgi:hypothetical protein